MVLVVTIVLEVLFTMLMVHISSLNGIIYSDYTHSSKVRDLGVLFDQFLNFDDHITAICRSTRFHIRNIGKIRNLLSYDACSTNIHALISCRLDYYNYILYNIPRSKTD